MTDAPFDTAAFDSETFGGSPAVAPGSTDGITFEGFGLTNPATDSPRVFITQLVEDSAPQRLIQRSLTPGEDGQIIETDRLPQKIVQARGTVSAATAALLESRLDEMKKFLRIQNGELKITRIGGDVRLYNATVSNFDRIFAGRGRLITKTPFAIDFLCTNPFARSEARVVNSFFTVTASPFDFVIEHMGNYTTKPIWIIQFDAAVDATVVNIKNNTTGQEIEITEAFTAGDVLEVNAEDKIVKLNLVEVDFDGSFWDLEPDANSITITITSTSHSATITEKHFTTKI